MDNKIVDELINAIWQYMRANPEFGNSTGRLVFNTTDATADFNLTSFQVDTTSANTSTAFQPWTWRQ